MNNDMYENLGKKMKELRIKNGLTQEQVADALNVTPGYISNVENNRSAMTLRMLIYYANLTHVSLDHLIGSIDSSYQATSLDNELLQLLETLSDTDKEKLIKTIKLWLLK
ncbi:helix-turn-helix domain-containing protein [Anaerosacchariphilus polymeriproducens]|uniref:XRE family transcriptional regulator n=1 Tax=Anaerosacchariphilus polymeriproducens TaxID=1812858 RepID=A0A371AXH8_9FIRM|nr:helix-turn-helix transcriptional regulator [Anaerosacchariphilus polymeriproducens]RDU24285.1 XRE family transcriptional regulator [Anaerosacchariphilus polymeriproducens]